jgi:hypothetical protein
VAFLLGVALATTTGATIAYLTVGSVADPSAESSGNDAIDYVGHRLPHAPAGAGLPQEDGNEATSVDGQAPDRERAVRLQAGPAAVPPYANRYHQMFAVGGYLGRYGNPWWHTLLFVGLTLLLAGAPLLILLLLGTRADVLLPKMRDWMQRTRGS